MTLCPVRRRLLSFATVEVTMRYTMVLQAEADGDVA
jgi:hypothetical protein